MTLRARTLTTFRTDDEASNRFQEHVKEVLNPVLRELGGQQGWQAPTLVNGWANVGGTRLHAGFWKDAFGVVRLRGTIAGAGIGTTAFVLPDGYRPSADAVFGVQSQAAFARVVVNAAGQVVPDVGSPLSVTLDGISFDTRP